MTLRRSMRRKPGDESAWRMQPSGLWIEPPCVDFDHLTTVPPRHVKSRYLGRRPLPHTFIRKPTPVAVPKRPFRKPVPVHEGAVFIYIPTPPRTTYFHDLQKSTSGPPTQPVFPVDTVIDANTTQEDSFHNRPTIKLPISDLLKGLLVDDWENITSKNQLVPIPHPKPLNVIFADYLDHERKRREEGSAALEILEETIDGLREYFNKALGHILLYR